MLIPKFLEDVSIISKLGNTPGTDNNLSATELKSKFDEAAVKIKEYINGTLIEKVNAAISLFVDPQNGLVMQGRINMNGEALTGLPTPAKTTDAIPLGFGDTRYLRQDENHTHSANDLKDAVPMTKGGHGATDGSTGLKNLLAAGPMILSPHQYGTVLPSNPVDGQFFVLIKE